MHDRQPDNTGFFYDLLSRPTVGYFFAMTFLIFLLTTIANPGLVALDEYNHAVVHYIPAQTANFAAIVEESGLRSPLQVLPMHLIAQGVYKLGVVNPLWQHRLVIIVMGLLGILLMLWAINIIFPTPQFVTEKKVALAVLGLHFLSPFLLTRPMFEAISAPWLFLSSAFALRYDQQSRLSDLLLAVLALTVSFLLRPHVGICGLVLVVLPLLKNSKRYKDFWLVSGCGLVCFIVTGLPDYFLRGRFHESMILMGTYNVEHGGMYSQMSFYFFFVVILAVTFSPFFIARYPIADMKNAYGRLRSLWLFCAIFLALHMLFENKYERYLLPILPIVLILLVPALTYMVRNFARYKIRLAVLVIINICLLIPTSFIVAQRSIFDFADFMNTHSQFRTLVMVERAISPLPYIFFTRSFGLRDIGVAELSQTKIDCDEIVALREDFIAQTDISKLREIAVLAPGPLEALVVRLNPEANYRRRPIHLYSACQ